MDEQRETQLSQLKAEHPEWGRNRLARETGISPASVQRWLKRQTSIDHDIADGYKLERKTVHYDAEGKVKQQWVRSKEDRENTLDLLKLAAEAIIEPCKGLAGASPQPENLNEDLMCAYPVADVHTGLFSWGKETGTDFDTKECSRVIRQGMAHLVNSAPNAATCLIPNLGDFFHTDSQENKTARSGHCLDVDTRWAKVFTIGVQAYRDMISMAAEKHGKVYVKSGIGNHDDHSIFSLAMLMKAYFENDDRVEVELPINPFAYHRFGVTLIGINHGQIKADRLPLIMAQDMRAEWGETKYSHWYVGHLHHKSSYEYPGCTVETFRSPSAKDAWTHASGYRSERDMQRIDYHVAKGEVGRTRIGVDYLV